MRYPVATMQNFHQLGIVQVIGAKFLFISFFLRFMTQADIVLIFTSMSFPHNNIWLRVDFCVLKSLLDIISTVRGFCFHWEKKTSFSKIVIHYNTWALMRRYYRSLLKVTHLAQVLRFRNAVVQVRLGCWKVSYIYVLSKYIYARMNTLEWKYIYQSTVLGKKFATN